MISGEQVTDDPAVGVIVMLAAPAGQLGMMFLNAIRVKLTAAGMEAKATERVVSATGGYLDALTNGDSQEMIAADRAGLVRAFVAGGWKQDLAEGAVKTLSEPATTSLYTVAVSNVLSRVRVPVLAIYAADDTVVSSALSIPEAQRVLIKNRDAKIVEMHNVEHGFKPFVSATESRDCPLKAETHPDVRQMPFWTPIDTALEDMHR